MRDLKIRLASLQDASSLVDLAEEFMPGKATRLERIGILKQALENPGYELLVAELDGEVVGFIYRASTLHPTAEGYSLEVGSSRG